jgi:hypothetical protein
MSRLRQPATRSGDVGARPDDRRATRADDPALYEQSRAGVRALRGGWAVTRWVALIMLVGLGAAIVVAIAMAALAALVNTSV